MAEAEFDRLFRRKEDEDVDEAGEASTELEMVSSHLVARCTESDIEFSLHSLSWSEFCENQKQANRKHCQ